MSLIMVKSEENKNCLITKKRRYKITELKLKREYKGHNGNMLNFLRLHNPRMFHKHFDKRKKSIKSNLSRDDFYEHLLRLAVTEPTENEETADFLNTHDRLVTPTIFDELDKDILEIEIVHAIGKLKLNKSVGNDDILNEYFIKCKDTLLPCLHLLFNNVFNSGHFPSIWSKGCIVPVFKKGDINDPNNYRGISLVSCMGKLFTSILNQRLVEFDKSYNKITDAQFGFRKNMSTVDAIFVLQALINRTLKNKKRLYCCFVDYKKAFDFVNRQNLWYKLIREGIDGKMLSIIRSLYQKVKCGVKYNGKLTNLFECKNGLFQGEILSPILFSFYVNDCEMQFLMDNCSSVEIQMLNMFLIMYADDMVIIAETPEGLQNMLDSLLKYTTKWDLTVNTDKTKIIIFRNGGIIREHETWTYNGRKLEIVEEFNYLGVLLNYNGKFRKTQQKVAEQGRKALFAIMKVCRKHFFNFETQLSVFDTYVNSILNYGCEIWGQHKAPDVERIHLIFLKKILGVRKNTINHMVYYELGRFPLAIGRKFRILKYWVKLMNTDNCILKACYNEMKAKGDSWLVNIMEELNRIGLGYIWDLNEVNESILPIFRKRLVDIFRQECSEKFNNCSKGLLYKHVSTEFCLQSYLKKAVDNQYLKDIARIRLSSHRLNVETGRYQNIDRRNRLCTLCNLEDIEDEFHFILKCPHFEALRKALVKPYYIRNTSVFKLVELLKTNSKKDIANLGKYISIAMRKRKHTLENT